MRSFFAIVKKLIIFSGQISGGGRRPPREREEIIPEPEQEQDWPRTVN